MPATAPHPGRQGAPRDGPSAAPAADRSAAQGRAGDRLRSGTRDSVNRAASTSYHLRQLERYGFVEEAAEQNRGRTQASGARWTRARSGRSTPTTRAFVEASSVAGRRAGRRVLALAAALVRRDARAGTGAGAAAAEGMDQWFELTPEELRSLSDEVREVLEPATTTGARRATARSGRSSSSTRSPRGATLRDDERAHAPLRDPARAPLAAARAGLPVPRDHAAGARPLDRRDRRRVRRPQRRRDRRSRCRAGRSPTSSAAGACCSAAPRSPP